MQSKLYYILIGILFLSCANENLESPIENDYVIFGHFYGHCIGESCVEIFKMENGKLYEDINDNYPSSSNPYSGDFMELSKEQFDLVKELNDFLPGELIEIDEIIIGCPDCSDGGGIYVELKQDGKIRYWMIDQFLTNLPEELHGLVNRVNEKISLLQ